MRWPVHASVDKWNQSLNVDSYYRSSCPSSTVAHCVTVAEYYSYSDGYYGYAYFNFNDATAHFNYASVSLNNYYSQNATRDRYTTCQELGHALGLAHNRTATDTCMNDGPALWAIYPNSHDYSQLASNYNH